MMSTRHPCAPATKKDLPASVRFSRIQGKLHKELAALVAACAEGFDPAAMHFNDVFDQRQSNSQSISTGALVLILGLGVKVEDARQLFGSDADTVIAHANLDIFSGRVRRQKKSCRRQEYIWPRCRVDWRSLE